MLKSFLAEVKKFYNYFELIKVSPNFKLPKIRIFLVSNSYIKGYFRNEKNAIN